MVPTVEDVIAISNQMLWYTFLLSMPVLITALVIGMAISLVQTVTSVQEMTITFVPKLIAVLAAIALTLPWMIQIMSEYTIEIFELMGS